MWGQCRHALFPQRQRCVRRLYVHAGINMGARNYAAPYAQCVTMKHSDDEDDDNSDDNVLNDDDDDDDKIIMIIYLRIAFGSNENKKAYRSAAAMRVGVLRLLIHSGD